MDDRLKNITSTELVKLLDVSRTTAWRIIKGKTSINIEEAYLIAQHYNVDLDVTIKHFAKLRQKED